MSVYLQEGKMSESIYRDVGGVYVSRIFSEPTVRSALAYKPHPGDVFIVSYPKCGTTWMQHIVYGIYNDGIAPKDMIEFMTRTPFLELLGADSVEKMPKPGAVKTHLPFNLQPYSPQAKYIYVTRNPYDCCASFYHHTRSFPPYKFQDKSFDDFFEMFVSGKCDFGDYFDHQLSWYEHKDDDNVLLVTYEDLKKDVRKEILKIANFLGEEYGTKLRERPDILENIVNATSVETMKSFNKEFQKWTQHLSDILPKGTMGTEEKDDLDKPMTGDFVRKGVVGDWRNHFSQDQIERLKERIAQKTRGSQLMSLWKDVELP